MDPALAGLLGGALGGVISAAGTLWAYAHGYLRVEKIEKRLAKIRLVDDIVAYRFALDATYPVGEADAHHFNKAMARIPYVFSDDKEIMAAYDEFMAFPKDTPKLMSLIRKITVSSGFKEGLPERYVSGVYSIRARSGKG